MKIQPLIDRLLYLIVDLINPFLTAPLQYQNTLKQKENDLIKKFSIVFPIIYIVIWTNALLFNDSLKTNKDIWFQKRLEQIIIFGIVLIVGFFLRKKPTLLKYMLIGLGYVVSFGLANFMTLGYPFRSQWLSYFTAPLFALVIRSPAIAALHLGASLLLTRSTWIQFHEPRFVLTEYEFTLLFIGLIGLGRKLWVQKTTAELELKTHQAKLIAQKQEMYEQFATFVPPVLFQRANHISNSGQSVTEAMNEILRLRKSHVTTLYSDLRNYSEKIEDLDIAHQVLIPQTTIMIDQIENNYGIAKLIGDALFAYYWLDDPEEGFLRALRDAWIQAYSEFNRAKKENRSFDRYFTLSFGEVLVGNVSTLKHKETNIMGKSPNIAARIDSLTKDPKIQKWIEFRPHVLLSTASKDLLQTFSSQFTIETYDLHQNDIKMKSYEDERFVHLMTLDGHNFHLLSQLLNMNQLPVIESKKEGALWLEN